MSILLGVLFVWFIVCALDEPEPKPESKIGKAEFINMMSKDWRYPDDMQ